jgi:hypothetical protein
MAVVEGVAHQLVHHKQDVRQFLAPHAGHDIPCPTPHCGTTMMLAAHPWSPSTPREADATGTTRHRVSSPQQGRAKAGGRSGVGLPHEDRGRALSVWHEGGHAGLEMLTGGLFTDDRWLTAFNEVDTR